MGFIIVTPAGAAAVSFSLKHRAKRLVPSASRPRSAMQSPTSRAGQRFLNQDRESVVGRQSRYRMAKMRARSSVQKKPARSSVQKKPAGRRPVPVPGNRHRTYPCCGRRRERCACDWSAIKTRLNSAEWDALLGRLTTAELKYAMASADYMVEVEMCLPQMRIYMYIYIWSTCSRIYK